MCDTIEDNCRGTLRYESVVRLKNVLEQPVAIDSLSRQFSTVCIRPIDLLLGVRDQLTERGVPVLHEIRLNGSAATHVVSAELEREGRITSNYNDLDLIFRVDINGHSDFERIRELAMSAFLQVAKQTGADNLPQHPFQVEEMYVRNMMKIWTPNDRWSLISFRNRSGGPDIELKFVGMCKRPYQFSIDSFQLHLDSYLSFLSVDDQQSTLSSRFFPTVVVQSMWGNYLEAVRHVQERLIATDNPESIYGGGLLKYCHLLTNHFQPAPSFAYERMESVMCTRFFIDFPDSASIQKRIMKYVGTHFASNIWCGMNMQVSGQSPMLIFGVAMAFLRNLHAVVERASPFCLTEQDRQDRLRCLQNLVRPPFLPPPGHYPALVCARRNHNQPMVRTRNHSYYPSSAQLRRARSRQGPALHHSTRSAPLVSECA